MVARSYPLDGRPKLAARGGSSFSGTPAGTDECFDLVEEIRDIKARSSDYPGKGADDENFRKLINPQTLKGNWFIPPNELGNEGENEFPQDLVDATVEYLNAHKGKGKVIRMSTSVIRASNGGWPFYIPGNHYFNDMTLLVNLVCAQALKFSGVDFLDDLQDIVTGYFPGLTASYTTFKRSRLTDAFWPDWKPSSNGAHATTETAGDACIPRYVYGAPGVVNQAGREGSIEMKEVMFSCSPMSVGTDAYNFSLFYYFYSLGLIPWYEDLSRFDTTASYKMVRQVGQIYSRVIENASFDAIVDRADNLDILGGPITTKSMGTLYRKKGMIMSGRFDTDIVGTLINFMRVVYAYATAEGVSYRTALATIGTKWWFKVKGDDTQLFVRKGFPMEKFNQASASLGFKSEGGRGCNFLMTEFDLASGRYYGLLSRFVINSFFREDVTPGPHTEALGMLARMNRLGQNPFRKEALHTVQKHSAMQNAFWRSFYQNPFQFVSGDSFRKNFMAETSTKEGGRFLNNLLYSLGRGSIDEVAGTEDMYLKLLGDLGFKVESIIPVPKIPAIDRGTARAIFELFMETCSAFDSGRNLPPKEEVLASPALGKLTSLLSSKIPFFDFKELSFSKRDSVSLN